jgi:hypothetical protein
VAVIETERPHASAICVSPERHINSGSGEAPAPTLLPGGKQKPSLKKEPRQDLSPEP